MIFIVVPVDLNVCFAFVFGGLMITKEELSTPVTHCVTQQSSQVYTQGNVIHTYLTYYTLKEP